MGVIVISLRTPQSAGENFRCTWEHLGVPKTSLGALMINLEVAMTSLGASGSASDKPGSTSNDCEGDWENDIFFGNIAGAPGNHWYYLLFNNF